MIKIWETASHYHLVHSVALLGIIPYYRIHIADILFTAVSVGHGHLSKRSLRYVFTSLSLLLLG